MKQEEFEDDGRTIAPMDVDGMRESMFRFRRKRSGEQKQAGKKEETPLTKREAQLMSRGIWLAYALTGLIFLGFFALFLLFCQFVWFS